MNFNSMEVFNVELKDITCAQYWPADHCVWDGSQHQPSHSSQSAFLHEYTAPGQKSYRYAEDGKAFKLYSDFYTSICDNEESIDCTSRKNKSTHHDHKQVTVITEQIGSCG
jgi:hypothetical protein